MGLLRRKPRLSRSAKRPLRSPLAEREQRAYVLLEEARLRYERLDLAPLADEISDLLHRELGMAGFCVSAHIPSQRRRALLAAARWRSGKGDTAASGEALERVQGLVRRAWMAVEAGRGIPELSDPMQEAHTHLLAAHELFGVITQSARHGSRLPVEPDQSAPSQAPTTKSP